MTLSDDEGLILRVLPHGEADKLVTWHGAAFGRVTALAKGAQKSKKRFTNKLEPFTRLRLHFRPPHGPSGLHFLEDAELLDAHIGLRRDWPRFLAANVVAELTLRFTRDLDADARTYELLVWALDGLDRSQRFSIFLLFFHLKLLEVSGYMPDFRRCRHCGRPLITAAALDLSGRAPGGSILRCAACAGGTLPPKYALSLQSARLLAHAAQASLDALRRLQPPPAAILEGLNLLHHFSQCLLQTDLRCWPVLRGMKRGSVPELPSCPLQFASRTAVRDSRRETAFSNESRGTTPPE